MSENIIKDNDIQATSSKNECLKLIAIVSMLIDHIGAIFYPQHMELRIIGRLAYPIFVYFLVEGYQYTSSLKNYLKRLLIFAIISQVPFMLAFDMHTLNVFFTLFLSLCSLHYFIEKKYNLLALIIMSTGILECYVGIDYGIYGIGLTLLFYIYKDDKFKMWISFIMFNLLFIFVFKWYYLQIYSVLSLIFIREYKVEMKINKYFFYGFYPVHLIILYLISIL